MAKIIWGFSNAYVVVAPVVFLLDPFYSAPLEHFISAPYSLIQSSS